MDRRTLALAARAPMVVMAISAAPAWAHHSFALFDSQKTVALEGTVKSFEWTNPHSWITLVVLNSKNAAEEWQIELPPAAMLAREGWNKRYLTPGEKIVVHINPLKDGRHGGALESFSPQARN